MQLSGQGPNRHSLAVAVEDDPYQEAAGFYYEDSPKLFLGRSGYASLRVAWDTNILSTYADYGHLMWREGEFDPPIVEPNYRAELIALNLLMQLWMMRDIRIIVHERQIYDARRRLDEAEWDFRKHQIEQFLAALKCLDLDVAIREDVRPFEALPEGSGNDDWDDSLVAEAVENGCHVFLTGDKRLRRRLYRQAKANYVVIMLPTELVQLLAEVGEFNFGGEGYILPDSHKWIHVMEATKEVEPGHE